MGNISVTRSCTATQTPSYKFKMSRFSTSLLSTAGLLLVTSLAIIPTKLHAETKLPATPQPAKAMPAATTAPATPATPANVIPAIVKPTVAAPAAATVIPAKVPTTTTVTAPIVKPSTGASIATPSKPATTTAIPAGQQPTVKPAATAATSQPPAKDLVTLTLKLKEKKVYVYKDGKAIANYPVAIGKKGWETPTGDWYVMEKIANPGWTSFKNSSTVIAPGTKSPLGERWIGFWTDGNDMIGFHGTPDVKSIGKAVSHGCVRMFDKDVKALFPLVKVGTTVKVVNE
jgi:lipoprotein-anchoring transpeptidase ErfK/SrfK